jgi:hypothetical protein
MRNTVICIIPYVRSSRPPPSLFFPLSLVGTQRIWAPATTIPPTEVARRSVPRADAPDPSARHAAGTRVPARGQPGHRAHLPFLTRLLVATASGYKLRQVVRAGQVASRFAVQNDHAQIIRFLPYAARGQLVGYIQPPSVGVWRHGGLAAADRSRARWIPYGQSNNANHWPHHTTSVGSVGGGVLAGECAVTCRARCARRADRTPPPPAAAAINTAGGIFKKVVVEWLAGSAPPAMRDLEDRQVRQHMPVCDWSRWLLDPNSFLPVRATCLP